jgi:hypothetical protein
MEKNFDLIKYLRFIKISFLLGADCTDELKVRDMLFLLVLVKQSFGRKPGMNGR